MGPYGATWAHIGPIWAPYGPIWVLLFSVLLSFFFLRVKDIAAGQRHCSKDATGAAAGADAMAAADVSGSR